MNFRPGFIIGTHTLVTITVNKYDSRSMEGKWSLAGGPAPICTWVLGVNNVM